MGKRIKSTDDSTYSPGSGTAVAEPVGRRVTEEQIRARAYEIFLANGQNSNSPLEDWLQAERELMSTCRKR